MDLQISVFLLFMLFTAGHTLSCYQCLFGTCEQMTCPSGNTNCLSMTYVGTGASPSGKFKLCVPASDCATGSLNMGSLKYSTSCCNTDLCNVQDAPDPPTAPNGNKCYYCDEQQNCSKVLNCSGNQDRCITSTGTVANQTMAVKGCVSKSICDATTSVSSLGIGKVTCCAGNLCNGAQSVTQSVPTSCEGNLCNGAQSVTQSVPTSCEGNLCNGAQSVTQSFLFLCCSLLSYFMMH